MSILTKVLIVFAFMFGALVGHTVGKVEWSHEDCYDANDRHGSYEAWLSVKDGMYRCFWIERSFPNRVTMQGVVDVK